MNDNETLAGSCLCGACKYSITTHLKHFFQCHCIQCRKMTASAFAANILAAPAEIYWLSGSSNIQRFDYPDRGFTQVFCKTCGSGLPFFDQGLNMLLIPAGSLDSVPTLKPEANIYWKEKASWCEHGMAAIKSEYCENTHYQTLIETND